MARYADLARREAEEKAEERRKIGTASEADVCGRPMSLPCVDAGRKRRHRRLRRARQLRRGQQSRR